MAGVIGIPAAILGPKMGQASKAKEDAATVVIEGEIAATLPNTVMKFHRVYCEEIIDGVQAVYLGEKKVWTCPRREMSWSTKDLSLLPAVGSTLQMEKTYNNGGVERFRMKVTKVEEI